MTLHLGQQAVIIGLPIWAGNGIIGNIVYNYIYLPLITDDGGNNNLEELLVKFAALNAQSPWWSRLAYDAPVTAACSRYTLIHAPYTGQLQLILTTVPPGGIDFNWNDSDYANYGYVRTYDGTFTRGIECFVESATYVVNFELANDAEYIEIVLKPGVTGIAHCYPWYGIPPIAYNANSQGWKYYDPGYPRNGKAPCRIGDTTCSPPRCWFTSPQFGVKP